MANRIVIHYCTGCRWLLRASWMAQELLTSFENELDEVALRPGDLGQFDIFVNDERVWCRKEASGFPEIKELKQCVRDIIAPEKNLGHSERND